MIKPQSDHWIQVEESPRRVRVLFAGATIADSKHAMLVREAGCLPVYYFPQGDVRMDLMQHSKRTTRCPYKGEASYWTIKVADRAAQNSAWSYPEPSSECAVIKGYIAFEWGKVDKWMEEEEEIFVHPRDPYKRVDVLLSSRHIRIEVGRESVAETRQPRLLIETNHPLRYYVPPEDIRMELLEPSTTKSRCPYKGIASYWSVRIGERLFPDLVWSYQDPIPECPKIKGLFCFFQEREAVIYVDGKQIPAPRTKWSR